jgi:hypothetical protein
VSDADTANASAAAGEEPVTSVCPGCGAVIAVIPGLPGTHPGASPSCAGLFAVTVRGLREEAAQDVRTASLLQLATDAAPRLPTRPDRWTTTVADLDVVDLPTLVRSWSDAVWTDRIPARPALRAAADSTLAGAPRLPVAVQSVLF